MAKPQQFSPSDCLIIGGLMIVSTVSLALLDLSPSETAADVAVVFPPWVDGTTAITRATSSGAMLMGIGRWPFVVIVRPIETGYVDRAMKAGALAVVDSEALKGCLTRAVRTT